jgi:two-component system invasion response regulator UvrY
VRPVIAAVPSFTLVGTATSGEEALEAIVDRTDVGLLLVDVHLPGISGIEVARRYRERNGRAVVVLMSTSDLADLPSTYLEADVAGFLPKETLSMGALTRLWEGAATQA